ncbi:MAG: hypothetical protein BECKG1743E_GA0114224_103117 [Candidatus Kentron sp. G]|nr:MAG: hypothetical protein BECKG1743E_GA0114224_103117 [Candidatus Kentron sp. G]
MKLLFDENPSFKLADLVAREFPGSSHIDLLKMQGSTDSCVWERAKAEDYIIVSKDNSHYWKPNGGDRIRLISKACRSISDKV